MSRDAYVENRPADAVLHGEQLVGVAAAQFAAVPARLVRVKALAANTGKVYLGASSAVTLPTGATNATTGLELAAGEETAWMPLKNLSQLWGIATAAAQGVSYMVLR